MHTVTKIDTHMTIMACAIDVSEYKRKELM